MTNEKSLSKKYIQILHTDLDGTVPAILAHHLYPNQEDAKVYFTANKDVNDRILKIVGEDLSETVLFIVDHSPSKEVYDVLVEKGIDYHIFDHHKTSEVKDLEDERIHFDLNECGTSLFYNYLLNTQDLSDVAVGVLAAMGLLVQYTRDYDLWIHEYPESKELNALLYETSINEFVERYKEKPYPLIDEREEVLLESLAKRKEAYLKKSLKLAQVAEDKDGKKYAWVVMEQFHSELGHHLLENLEIDYAVLMDIRNYKVSLRGHGDIDLGASAKLFAAKYEGSGGGHEPAAGFTYAPHRFTEVWNELCIITEE